MLHAVPVQSQESAPRLFLKRDAASCELCLAAPRRREMRVSRSLTVERENGVSLLPLTNYVHRYVLSAVQTTVGGLLNTNWNHQKCNMNGDF
jgi:hypothetical protein